jgi:hypothetical protein
VIPTNSLNSNAEKEKTNNSIKLTTTIKKATVEKLLPNFVTICLENSPRLTIHRINTRAPDNHCITSWAKLYKSWRPVSDLPKKTRGHNNIAN